MVLNRTNVDVYTWNGTLSATEFYKAAHIFTDKWKTFNSTLPPWSWIACSNRPWIPAHEVEGYLSLEDVFLPMSVETTHDDGNSHREVESCDRSDEDEPIDSAVSVTSYGHEVHHYNFHVVYSTTYKVPVLYFQGYSRDGQPLTLDDIQKDLPVNSAKVLRDCKWTFITLEEHAYLNRPWYTLHPCGTSEWMKLLLTSNVSAVNGTPAMEQYIVSWFSVVGQAIGLKIPFDMLTKSFATPL